MPGQSDLAKDNFDRVAAPAVQLRQILLKDAGLMVELKHWVAKEATDSGQIVDDSELTDQAIFDRLERDVVFRSVATRLVQQFGYLVPTVNPDSDLGKEQDLLLKERVRIFAIRESQDDAKIAQPPDQNKLQSTSECDPKLDPDCEENPMRRGRRRRWPNYQDTEPPMEWDLPNLPSTPQALPSLGAPSMLRAGGLGSGGGLGDSDSSGGGDADNFRAARLALSGGGLNIPDLSSSGNQRDLSSLLGSRGTGLGSVNGTGTHSNAKRIEPAYIDRLLEMEKELAPVAMVHKPTPYADIPSLYDLNVQASPRNRPLERFGVEVFENGIEEMDQIPMDVPASPDYVVGPGDGLSINLWGGMSTRMSRTIDREGRVNLPEAGPVLVSGQNLAQVQETVQQVLRTQYRNVSVDVSLSRLRTVRVYVVGDVADPGAYDISALSTPLNALFEAGGVTPGGSLRSLKHYRGTQLVEEVDAYDLLLHGVRGDLKRLENGDSLLVSPIGPQVTVEGMVRRPAIYELHGGESLEDVVELAGGILPAAALRHIEVQRVEAHEKRTMLSLDIKEGANADEVAKQLSELKIQDGDQIHIFPIGAGNENAIYLQGHVVRPGRYSYRDGMRLTDLISSYSDLLPEPSAHYAEIVRLNAPDFHPSVESFDLATAMAKPESSPKLQAHDTVRIFGRFDFELAPAVWVGGEVRAPGKYVVPGQSRLQDAIYQAGGLTPDASLDTAQLFRTEKNGMLKILSVNLGGALAGNSADNIVLEPRDRLLIHRVVSRVDPATVYIKGEVAKPGRYPLTGNMQVEDLVRVAGGLKRSADINTADLTRYAEGEPGHISENVKVNLSSALNGDSNAAIALRDGDVLSIRQRPGWMDIAASVTVRGEVQHSGSYGILPGERLSSVLERAGGFGPQAYPYGAVLMRREVRDLEMKNYNEIVQRLRIEEVSLKALPEGDPDQKNAKLSAISQTQTALDQLQSNPPVGRVVIRVQTNVNSWRNTTADVSLRDGDVLVVPKKAGYISVTGQVFNPTAVSYRPGRSAKWYLSQAGGLTMLADKKAVFVVRADGSVISARNNTGLFSGDPLNATLRPGDSIVVPEKAPKIGGLNWTTLIQTAQIASSLALTISYLHP
jgi:protein involved in polysaccharide export with SLBB domain